MASDLLEQGIEARKRGDRVFDEWLASLSRRQAMELLRETVTEINDLRIYIEVVS